MPWSDFQRLMYKPWWVSGTSGFKTVNIGIKVKILSLRDYVAPSLGQWITNPGAAALRTELARVLSNAVDMDAALFDRMAKNVKDGIAKHWSRDLPNGFTGTVTTEDSTDDRAITIVLAKALQADLPGGVGKRSFNLATFGDGLPTVDLYDPSLERSYTSAELDSDMAETGAHELGHSVLRARPGGGIYFSLTHKGTSSVGQETLSTAPNYPSSGEIDVMYYYNAEPGIRGKRFNDTKAASEDVEGLVDMCMWPPWVPG